MTVDLWKSLFGGMLIGAGAATLLLLNGKIAGISGTLDNAVGGVVGPQGWRPSSSLEEFRRFWPH
jgi:uncharacterized protein